MTTVELSPLSAGSKPSNIRVPLEIPKTCAVLDDGEDAQKLGWNGCFRVLTQEDGDKRLVWRIQSIPEINDAKKMFDDLVAQGFVPYRVGHDGKAAEVMTTFDPTSGEILFQEIVMVPKKMVAGG